MKHVAAAWILALVCGACSSVELYGDCEADPALSSDSIVHRTGRTLVLDGKTFLPTGTNAYWVLEAARAGRMDRVDALFDAVVPRGVNTVRIWAFDQRPSTQIHRMDGSMDETALVALDEVVAAAADRGLRLVLVLSNGWSDYGGIDVYAAWAGHAAREDALASEEVRGSLAFYGMTLAGRTNTVSGRVYRDDPAILGWDLINELRCERCPPGRVTDFMADVAGRLRSADDLHPIGAGDEGFVGEHGVDVALQARSANLDWVSLHLWPQHHTQWRGAAVDSAGVAVRVIAEGRRLIQTRSAIAEDAGLPLLVGEMGWHRDLGGGGVRGVVLGAWVDEARIRGAGSLTWMWADDGMVDYDGYVARTGDPATQIFCR